MNTNTSQNGHAKESEFLWVGNHPALDLVNTLALAKDGQVDLLTDAEALSRWLVEAKIVTAADVKRIAKAWTRQQGETFLSEVKGYRGKIKELVAALGEKRKVPASFIEETNRILQAAPAVLEIKATGADSFARSWSVAWEKPASVLGLIAEQGLRLVCDCDLSLVRKCESDTCILAFYDTTKNHQRRWCSMESCGNRHKATLHRHKVRQESQA